MKQLSVEEIKNKELEILVFFHEYCEKNKMKYWLTAGSLIGAIRHKGFIPWDDDIDVGMPREDYMRLIEKYPKEGINGLKLLNTINQKDCPITFSKLYDVNTIKKDDEVEEKYQKYGVDIDIFPYDFSPRNHVKFKWVYMHQYIRFKFFLGIVGKYRKERSTMKSILKKIFMFVCKTLAYFHIISADKISIKMNKTAMKYKSGEYLYESMQPSKIFIADYAKSFSFSELILCDFENKKFYIPKGYDEVLRSSYGDYLILPPIEKRTTHHLSHYYSKEDL